MILCFKILLLFVYSFSIQAEAENPPHPYKPDTDNIQVYTKQSIDAVEALNHATEVLRDPVKAFSSSDADKKAPPVADSGSLGGLPRDPTQMSGNFRQSLKDINTPTGTAGTVATPATQQIPVIELAAKMLGKHKSVMLKVNNRVVQVSEGKQISLFENKQVIDIRVDGIDKNQVKISVLPFNKHLILQ